MVKEIYYITGCKGGTGKTLFAISLLDHLEHAGRSVLAIDADLKLERLGATGAIRERYQGTFYDPTRESGWLHLLDTLEDKKHADKSVVIDAQSSNIYYEGEYGGRLTEFLEKHERPMTVFCLMDDQPVCRAYLRDYLRIFPNAPLYAVFKGNPECGPAFKRFASCEEDKQVCGSGGGAFMLPNMGIELVDELCQFSSESLQSCYEKAEIPVLKSRITKWRKKITPLFYFIL